MSLVSRRQRAKKEFPFTFALCAALALHFLIGVAIKRNMLIAANPVPPAPPSKAPVTMRFVEVPPNSKTVPVAPKTKNVSDANRKAGPLKPLSPGEMRMPSSPGKQGPRVVRQKRPEVPQQQAPPQQMAQVQAPPVSAPPVQVNPSPSNDSNTIPLQRDPGNTQKNLSASLQDLDRYIRNQDGGDGGIYSPKEGSPSGDTGSGVFFDTQGFDLGPWGNRVVAIVKQNWIVPVAAQLGLKGVVSISFEVEKATGNFINLNIVSSSNIPSFDQAALNAMKSSNPLPLLPADFPRPTLAGVFRFYYNIPITNE